MQWTGLSSARHVLNRTARIATAAHTEIASDESRIAVKRAVGDVLVSPPTAVREHEIARIGHVLKRWRATAALAMG